MSVRATGYPTALISYSHDSPAHEQRVLELCNRLRARGIDAFVDQFLPGAPSEGWPLWMERQIESRDFTLMVCTETYRRRFMEDEATGVGLGVVWEARILRNLLYEDPGRHRRIVPLLLSSDARAFVPTAFRGHFFDVSDERGFEGLIRHLLHEPGAPADALNPLGAEGSLWSAFQRPWLVPDARRTLYFTGRDELLDRLRAQLVERKRAALSGLGGVGKTQTAIEYAIRYRAEYPDGVFWTTADSQSELIAGFVEIASVLQLAAAASSDQEQIVRSVRDWFNAADGSLLILDNVEDWRVVEPFTAKRGSGHVLVTSRESTFHELGIARGLEVGDLDDDEGVSFLLKRAGREDAAPAERGLASELARELGNLPLALEQAAAYIAETSASFSDYSRAFRKRRISLLERGGSLVSHDTVAVTWAPNFEAVAVASAAATDVMRVAAFLSSVGIPFELFESGADALGAPIASALQEPDELAMTELLRPLARYSLIRIDRASRSFGVHRLVQEIVRSTHAPSAITEHLARITAGLASAFPKVVYATWKQCDRLIPHIVTLAGYLETYDVATAAAADLLNDAGFYLRERSRYRDAQAVLRRAIAMRRRLFGEDDPSVASSLQQLATTHWYLGEYAEAQPLYERALAIRERTLGPDHLDVATTLSDLAGVHAVRRRNAEARPLFERALSIFEGADALDRPNAANTLVGLATLALDRADLAEARAFNERARSTWERTLGPDHPYVTTSLRNLAAIDWYEGNDDESEALYERAHAIVESALGPDHLEVAQGLDALGTIHTARGRLEQAWAAHERAFAIQQDKVGADHPEVAASLCGLANVHIERGSYAQAERLFERALGILEQALGPDHPYVAFPLDGLANVRLSQGRLSEAESLYARALSIRERALAPEHPEVVFSLVGLAGAVAQQGRTAEAVALLERAEAINQRILARSDHHRLVEIRKVLDALRAGAPEGGSRQ